MGEPYIVNMDRYWNYVATPLFLVTLLFGMISLFSMSSVQFAAPERVRVAIDALRRKQLTATPVQAPALAQ